MDSYRPPLMDDDEVHRILDRVVVIDDTPEPTPIIRRTDWIARAACRGMPPALFYPERGEAITPALEVCATCSVAVECLEHALAEGERRGIWGGTSERQRRALRKEMDIAPTLKPIAHGTHQGFHQHERRGEKPCVACREARARYNFAARHPEQDDAA